MEQIGNRLQAMAGSLSSLGSLGFSRVGEVFRQLSPGNRAAFAEWLALDTTTRVHCRWLARTGPLPLAIRQHLLPDFLQRHRTHWRSKMAHFARLRDTIGELVEKPRPVNLRTRHQRPPRRNVCLGLAKFPPPSSSKCVPASVQTSRAQQPTSFNGHKAPRFCSEPTRVRTGVFPEVPGARFLRSSIVAPALAGPGAAARVRRGRCRSARRRCTAPSKC